MIAEIYGKISRSGSNLSERLEYKLTGDIFGALRYLPAEMFLLPFIRKAYWINPNTHKYKTLKFDSSSEPEVVFWPSNYPNIEPDVEITGTETGLKVKIFIEVKYKSGLSSDDKPGEEILPTESNNQLFRQIRVLDNDVECHKKILIFLTEDGSYPKEIMDRVSKLIENRKMSSTRLYWLSWNETTSLAAKLLSRELSIFERRIIKNIKQLCIRKGFKRYKYHPPAILPCWKFVSQFNKNISTPSQLFHFSHFSTYQCLIHSQWSFCNE